MCGPRITTIEPRSCQQRATMNKHMPQTPPQTLSIRCQFAVHSLSITCPFAPLSVNSHQIGGSKRGFRCPFAACEQPYYNIRRRKGVSAPWLALAQDFLCPKALAHPSVQNSRILPAPCAHHSGVLSNSFDGA